MWLKNGRATRAARARRGLEPMGESNFAKHKRAQTRAAGPLFELWGMDALEKMHGGSKRTEVLPSPREGDYPDTSGKLRLLKIFLSV